MSVVYRASLKATRMQSVLDDIDNNAAAAHLKIQTAGGGTLLANITLAKPSFSRAAAVLTLLGVPISDLSADATGTAAEATIEDGAGNVIVSGLTVGTSGANLIFNSVAFQVNQEIRLDSGTITHG
jgi:hypothetical protein